VLAIFALTSSGSVMGAGVTLGVYLRYLMDIEEHYQSRPEILKKRLFWQLKMEVSGKAERIFLLLMLGGFILASGMFVR